MGAPWPTPNGATRTDSPSSRLHGTPGSRLGRHYDESDYVDAGARVITYDRPGYGGSDRHPGRRVVDCVEDVGALADHLGIERFAVLGGSGGGPHALAVAARLPDRVTRATCVVGIVPYDTEDFDFFAGMDANNVKEFGWALEGEAVLVPELEREAAEILERVAADPSKLLGDDWDLSEADRAELARKERHDVIRQSTSESFRNGVWGWVDDDLCFLGAMGLRRYRDPRADSGHLRPDRRARAPATRRVARAQRPRRGGRDRRRSWPLPDPALVAERYGWLVQPV